MRCKILGRMLDDIVNFWIVRCCIVSTEEHGVMSSYKLKWNH